MQIRGLKISCAFLIAFLLGTQNAIATTADGQWVGKTDAEIEVAQKQEAAHAEMGFLHALVLAHSESAEYKLVAAQMFQSPFSFKNLRWDNLLVERASAALRTAGVDPNSAHFVSELKVRRPGEEELKAYSQKLTEQALKTSELSTPALWLARAGCFASSSKVDTTICANEALALERLVEQDSKNAAVWLLMFNSAHADGDFSRADIALQRMAESDYYYSYFLPISALYMRAFDTVSEPEWLVRVEDEQLTPIYAKTIAAIGSALALGLPGSSNLMDYCGPKQNFEPRHELCQRVANLMVYQSDTTLSESIGFRMLYRLNEGNAAAAKIEEDMRIAKWQREQFSKVIGDPRTNSEIIQLRADWLAHNSEQAMAKTVLTRANIPLTPPKDFVLTSRELLGR